MAQSGNSLTIRVEANEVVVPVVVIDKSDIHQSGSMYQEFDKEITGLSLKDFRVFEDGREQRIQNFAIEPEAIQGQDEFSRRGIWSRPGLQPVTNDIAVAYSLHDYLLSYIPPPSPEGSCHKIKVKVNHRHATVSVPEEYCKTKYPTSDPVNGTKLGNQMESFGNSNEKGKLPVFVQVASLPGDSDADRIDIAVEFPSNAVKREWRNTDMVVTIAVLGMVYDKGKALAARL